MLFSRKVIPASTNVNIYLNNVILEQVKVTKFLGVLIDEKLNWKDHINCIKSKVSKGIGIINHVKNILPRNILKLLYNTLVHPYLSYCNIVWGTAKVSTLNPLFLLQKRVIRMCTNSHYRASSGPLFSQLKILNIFDLNKYLTCIFIFKYTNNLLPSSCTFLIDLPPVTCNYTLKNVGTFKINRCKMSYKESSVSVRGIKFWNSLPNSVSTSLSIGSFKNSLHAYLSIAYSVTL